MKDSVCINIGYFCINKGTGLTRTFFIYKDFEVYSVDEFTWRKDKHRHNFFELLYIEYGQGTHILNANEHSYKSRDVYFLTPGDTHSFKTSEPTRFHCLRFLPAFFNNSRDVKELEKVFYYHNQADGALKLTDDAAFCESIILKIVDEAAGQKRRHEGVVRYLMLSLLELIRRNMTAVMDTRKSNVVEDLKIDSILLYIRSNIANPQMLRIKIIAERFNVSVNYIGEYFKKQSNVTLRAYIEQTKLNIIKEKLSQSNLTFSEIGSELGFTDSSHFHKFVLRHTGKSPSQLKTKLKSR